MLSSYLLHRPGVLRFPTCQGRILITSLIGLSFSLPVLRDPTTHSFELRIPLLDMDVISAQSLGYIPI